MNRWSPFIAGCLLASAAAAQDWAPCGKEELVARSRSVVEQYNRLPAYVLSMTVASYRSITDKVPYETITTRSVQAAKGMRTEAPGALMIQNASVRVTAVDQERMLMLSKPIPMTDDRAGLVQQDALERASSIAKRVVQGWTWYQVVCGPNSEHDRLIIAYDDKGWLRRIECHWRSAMRNDPWDPASPEYRPKVVIDYTVPGLIDAERAKVELDVAGLVTWKDGQATGVGRFAGYQVFDTRLQ